MRRVARAWLALLIASGLAACSMTPLSPGEDQARQDTHTSVSKAEAAHALKGQVLGRNERLAIYLPAPGETLPQILPPLALHFLGSADLAWRIADFNKLDADPAAAPHPLLIPLVEHNPLGVYSDRYQTIPILCYHRFGRANGGATSNKMTVSTAAFAEQLSWLQRNGYHVLKLADLRAWLDGQRTLPLKSVVITVDDGYASFFHQAYPLLKQFNMPATLFVYTDFIGAGDGVDWLELQAMSRAGLVDVQSHSRTHRNLIEHPSSESDAAYQQALFNEIKAPRDLLAQRLSTPQTLYAYPYGDANEAVLAMLGKHGYQLAVTVNAGGNAFFAQPLMLRRTMIFGDMSLDDFKARLQISRLTGAHAP
ncbi:MAG: polysaccharide deacetylase family protein [Aquabacterium sp.]|uniref:polysaccharide deacetylase family protein n=1 Tax=Aquabacterium sp. TaxID=1872578 RepID=UPI00122BD966|nr:polysaccharide deacetylase family protein [Aquabacterium sp.]TAK87541.1 MAG: polysaccharide deacetylase family protein [Aquabacterium sp.]